MEYSTLLTASLLTTQEWNKSLPVYVQFSLPLKLQLPTMPRADPIVKHGVYNRREKITIDGLTATRAHHQTLKRQRMKEKHIDRAKVKRVAAGKAVAP